MKKLVIIYLLLVLIVIFGCSKSENKNLRIAVAANVQFAMKELVAEFNKYNDTKIEQIISSSGKLTAQIEQGAPFDIFFSADEKYPNYLFDKGLTHNQPEIYAQGKLVIITRDSVNSLSFLSEEKVTKIAVPNPKTAPYGVAAVEAFQKGNIMNNIEPKIVYGESISQVNQYIFSNSVDASITALSVVSKKDLMNGYNWYEIPDSLYKNIKQAVVKVKRDNQNIEMIDDFYNFVFLEKAKNIFEKYGYKVD